MASALAEPAPVADAEVEIDERFEYDAPRFYDFDEGSPAGAQPDRWFDTDAPKGLASPVQAASTAAAGGKEPAAAAAAKGANKPAQGAAAGASENQRGQHQGGDAGKAGSKGKGSEWRRALAAITNTKGQQGQAAAKSTSRKAAPAAGAAEAAGTSKARPTSAKQQQQQPAQQAEASTSQATATRRVAAPQQQQHKHAATAARSPRLHSRQRAHTGEQKTSEQLELEQVEKERQEAAQLRRRNAETVKHVLQPAAPLVVHSNKPLTEPVGVELCTAKRRRMHNMETRSMASPFKSTAEKIAAFEGKVPGKTRLGEGGSSSAAAAAAAAGHPTGYKQPPVHGGGVLTVPMSPQFATKKRVRPPRFKPREVVEEEEMAAMPKFKARPLNKRIMQDRSGHLGVPHVGTKPPTVPEPFSLKTDQRAAEHAPSSSAGAAAGSSSGGMFVFQAQGEGGRVTRSKSKKGWTGQLTHPEPFQLATDARGAIKRSAAAEPQQEAQDVRPVKRARKTAGPFQLATDLRGAAEEARLEAIRRQQEEQARQEAEFKALPLNKAVLAHAWKPAPHAAASLTVPEEVVLHSDARAAARRQFDKAVAAKQAEQEAEQRAREEEQQQQEEEETRQYRKKLGHKALLLPEGL